MLALTITALVLSFVFDILFVWLLFHHGDDVIGKKLENAHLLVVSLFGGTLLAGVSAAGAWLPNIQQYCEVPFIGQAILPIVWSLPLVVYAERHLRACTLQEKLHTSLRLKTQRRFSGMGKGIRRVSMALAHTLHLDKLHVPHTHPHVHMPHFFEECTHVNESLTESAKYIRDHFREILCFTIPGVLLHVGLIIGLLHFKETDSSLTTHLKDGNIVKGCRSTMDDAEADSKARSLLLGGAWLYWLLVALNCARKLRHFHDGFRIVHELKLAMVATAAAIIPTTYIGHYHLVFLAVVFVTGFFLAGQPSLKLKFPKSSVKYLLQKVHVIEVS
jgi:hypothetical protein